MTDQEYRDAIQNVIYLVGCAVNGTTPEAGRVHAMNLEQLYKAASRHLLTAITAMALESAGVRDAAFTQAKGKAIRKVALFDAERVAVLRALEEAGIWYMPLKGSVMKGYYPKFGMRQMADNDILYDVSRSADVRTIMESLGFTTVMYVQNNYNHDHYDKEPVCNFEMHRALFAPVSGDRLCDYYLNIKDRLVKDKGNAYGYHFTDEDFYIYITAHEYKHYSGSGTGLRSILDTYVFLKRFEDKLDWKYIAGEMDKLGIADYERQNRSLALHLFGSETLTTEDKAMLQYIIGSGTYGNRRNYVGNQIKKLGGGTKGKLKYLKNRIILPMESVESGYPFFYRHKVLMPFLWLWRICKALTIRRKIVWSELRALREIN